MVKHEAQNLLSNFDYSQFKNFNTPTSFYGTISHCFALIGKSFMKRLIFTLITVLFTLNLHAVWDYSAQTIFRSFPIGGFVSATFGKSFKFWHKKPADAKKPDVLYGYIRPSMTYQTSAVVNSIRPQIDFFPLSIFGFYIGHDRTSRHVDIRTFDCQQVYCHGELKRTYGGHKMALGFKGFFLVSDFKIEKVLFSKKDRRFVDERVTLEGAPGKDYFRRHQLMLGKSLSKKFALGVLSIRSVMRVNRSSSHMKMLFSRYVFNDKWSLLAAVGSFETRHHQEVFSSILALQWKGKKGLSLF